MLSEIEHFYFTKKQPLRDCLLALKVIILNFDQQITPEWKYKLPFFYYKGKMLCYLWIHKKFNQPYIGIVNGYLITDEDLLKEDRKRMKILLIDPDKDLPIEKINTILTKAIYLQNEKI